MRNLARYLGRSADLASRELVSGSLDGIEHVVVIPALAERDNLPHTLECLGRNAEKERKRTLIIVVVNNRRVPLASQADIDSNLQTLEFLDSRVQGRGEAHGLRLAYIDAASEGHALPDKAGVGTARKTGLDWATHVLAEAGRPEGLLFSLDADTHVEPTYLSATIAFFERTGCRAAVIPYAHRLDGPRHEVEAIICYEIFLRYYVLGLAFAGSPYAFHSVGSTMVCTTRAYAGVSGMNQRQAGEDFYFLQQLAKTVGVATVTGTTVHPSARPSHRVPFGTGQRVQRFLAGSHPEYVLYSPESFDVLRQWLLSASADLDRSGGELAAEAGRIASPLGAFLAQAGFAKAWDRIRANCGSERQAHEQFHSWFDGFRTLKLIHFLRDKGYPEVEMFEALRRLLDMAQTGAPEVTWAGAQNDLEAQGEVLEFLRAAQAG